MPVAGFSLFAVFLGSSRGSRTARLTGREGGNGLRHFSASAPKALKQTPTDGAARKAAHYVG